ncbi:MAG: outer membrane beta-barrel protein [Thermoguttaceae bacterium]
MRITTLVIAGGICALLCLGEAHAQTTPVTGLNQPSSVQPAANPNDANVMFAAQDGATPPAAPAPSPAAAAPSPSDQATEKKPEEAKKDEEKKDEETPPEDTGFKLFKNIPILDDNRIDVRGWIDQGFTWNPSNPANGFNGPVGYNDRANEYMLDQTYLIMERVTKVENDCGVDVGGRVDLLYGEDHRYDEAAGLDTEWYSGRFYGLAMPQMYADLAINKWVFRAGHFLAPVGYESVMAPENFFYSHSYGFLYGQPTTLSGGEAMYKVNDRWTANFGIDTGWNDWTSSVGKINYFGGVNWTSKDQKSTLAWETFIGNTDDANPQATRVHYDLVFTQKIGEKWQFAFEHNLGYDSGAVATNNGFTHGDWFSFAPYFIYTINDCWSAGMRYEWFSDIDGIVVEQVGPPTIPAVPAIYNALTWGVNWKPHKSKNVLIRSELRYDWANDSLPAGQRPFDAGEKNTQFLWATDLIVRF